MAHRSTGRMAVVCALGAGLFLGPWAMGDARAEGSLTIEPPVVESAPQDVTASGACPGVSDPDGGTVYPAVVRLTMDGGSARDVPVHDGGAFSGSFTVPAAQPPGTYVFHTSLRPQDVKAWPSCDATATLMVRPVLRLSRTQARPGGEVTGEGTCGTDVRTVDLLVGKKVLVSGPVAARTGAFGPLSFTLPADTPSGPVEVVSSCGGRAGLQVTATSAPGSTGTPAPTPTDTPDLVTVPNLIGLTQQQARARVDGLLVLAAEGSGDRVIEQSPGSDERVTRGSTVTATLGPQPPTIPVPLVVVAGVVVVAAVGAPFGWRARRASRERRWIRGASYELREDEWRLPDAPDEPVRTVEVHLEVGRTPESLHFQEVGHDRA